MARFQQMDTYLNVLVYSDTDGNVILPNPLRGGGPLAIGASFTVIDNLGTAATSHITPVGPVGGGGTSGTAISANYGRATMIWNGSYYTQGP